MRSLPHDSSSGRRVGRYLICGQLASGGMATVHLGQLLGPVGFSKVVAVKRLHEQFALEPDFVSMFIDEARLASSINHPNVVGSLDVVAEGDELWLVMEYVHGEALSQLLVLSRQRLSWPSVPVIVKVLCDTLEGLQAAHTASVKGRPLAIVHRDVSPQNVMVGADGASRVLDFGIAKAASRSQTTRPGQVKGKFGYMSPEQVKGEAVDARTDLFAAGVVLWEALTRKRLFYTEDPRTTVTRVLSAKVLPPSHYADGIPRGLDDIVLRAVSREPEARFQSALEFADALRRAAPEASRADVGRWVTTVASDVLDRRLDLLEETESSSVSPRRPAPRVPGPIPASVLTAAADDAATVNCGPPLLTATSTVSPELTAPRRSRLTTTLALALPAAAILTGAVLAHPELVARLVAGTPNGFALAPLPASGARALPAARARSASAATGASPVDSSAVPAKSPFVSSARSAPSATPIDEDPAMPPIVSAESLPRLVEEPRPAASSHPSPQKRERVHLEETVTPTPPAPAPASERRH